MGVQSLYFSYSDRPLKFYTANTDKVANKMLDPYKGKCQPVFMLFKVRGAGHSQQRLRYACARAHRIMTGCCLACMLSIPARLTH